MGKSKKAAIKVAPVESKPGLGGTTFGGFQDPGYITVEDEYVKKNEIPSRHVGANMTTVPPKEGRTPDVYFDKTVKRLDDKFCDPGRSETEKKVKEQSKKLVLSGPWKHPSPGRKATGAGTYVGTFSEKTPIAHEQDYDTVKRGEKPEPPRRQPRNIGAHTLKTGGFGMCGGGIYFSNPEPPKDGKGDPYDFTTQKEREERATSKKKEIGANGGKPFRSSSKVCVCVCVCVPRSISLPHLSLPAFPPPPHVFPQMRATFDSAEGSGVSKIYASDKALPPIKDSKGKDKETKSLHGPFKYTSPPKCGEAGCLNIYTKSMEGKPDVYDARTLKEKEDRKKGPKFLAGNWKVTSGPKAGCTRSLLKKYY